MKKPWWILWIWISGIMLITLIFGWYVNNGDPAFGRLSASGKNIPHPQGWVLSSAGSMSSRQLLLFC